MKKIVFLFGNTCTGKSTIGKMIEEIDRGISYVSFGDIKRKEINKDTLLAKKIVNAINNNLPINPKDGLDLIKKYQPNTDCIILSGYPISQKEYQSLIEDDYQVVFGVQIIDEFSIIKERFFNRGMCPVCDLPGVIGGKCPNHNMFMIRRIDSTEKELIKRINLFEERILPFINVIKKESLFPIIEYKLFSQYEIKIIQDIKKYFGR